ncbi:unnamed protein product [Acanthoscelides obtectus]|nr:unnamed protein product [Acanthoscelides obtectus]CAK1637652.1 Cytochrome P450 6a2 [Acanthoscelides obtectus]
MVEMEAVVIGVINILTGIVLAVLYVQHCYSYWKRRNVPYLTPKFPLGNHHTLFPKGISIGNVSREFYNEFKKKGVKLGGIYMGLQPQLVVTDPLLAKNVLITDYQHFDDRGIYKTKSAPITVNIFAQAGSEWKNARSKFTPTFTVAKMKSMFDTVRKCSEIMEQHLLETVDEDSNKDIEMLEVMACFTTDVIGAVIFGIDCNSFKHHDAEFRKMGRHLFEEFHYIDGLKLFLTIYLPTVSDFFGVSNIQTGVTDFFTNSVKEAVEYREKTGMKRPDFLQTLLDMKAEGKLTFDEVVGQAFLFFAAGFETSSNAGTMCLYELALQQDLQDKVRANIHSILNKYDGEVTYDTLNEMKYLNQVFEETLRLWPPVSTLTRVCSKDYTFPGTEVSIEKGVMVLVPLLAMQRDPDYWHDPLKFDPDRFEDEIDKNLPYWPFGEGPRNCLGTKFGYMQVKMGIVQILKNFKVTLSPKTKVPVQLHPETFVLHTTETIFFRLEKI